jgi:hypothetical protein
MITVQTAEATKVTQPSSPLFMLIVATKDHIPH